MALSESPKAQAQRELLEPKCPVCGMFKKPGQCFCRVCFFSLPPSKRNLIFNTENDDFASMYNEVKDYLRLEMDRGKK